MTTCLCLQHDNQFIEYVCLDNKCKQKLHCNKCVKFFGKDHYLVDLKRVQHSLSRLSMNDKLVTSRNFELADQDLVQFVEGNDPREKQEQYLKSLHQEREEVRHNCMQDIHQSIEQVMKDNQKSLYNLEESLQKCYSRKIDEIISLDQLKNQSFKHKALLLLQSQIKNSEYTELNESIMKLHSGKYELMYAKQLNKQIFFEMQQKITSFIKTQNEMINSFCGQFQSLFQLQIESVYQQQNHRSRQISKSGMLIKPTLQQISNTKLPSTTNLLSSFKSKNDLNIYGIQNKFYSQDLINLNKNLLTPIIPQQSQGQANNSSQKLSGLRQTLTDIKKKYNTNSISLILPSALSPDNMNHTKIYQIKSIGNLDTHPDCQKEIETPFKTNNYQTQTQKTIKPNSTVKKQGLKSKQSFQFEDEANMYSIPDKLAAESSKTQKPQRRNVGTLNTLDLRNNLSNSYSILPTTILNSSINGQNQGNLQTLTLKAPILNQTFERQIKSIIQINEETFVFGTVDGFMKIMEINNGQKCIYEIESKQAHQKLFKLKKCWEENGEILFFSNGIDEGGQNSIKLWQMRKGVSDMRQILILQDLHGKSMIDQVLFLKLERVEGSEQKIIYFASLSTGNKKQVIKICLAKIDFSYIKRNTQQVTETNITDEKGSQEQQIMSETTSCKVEVLTEITEELVNKIRKLSHFDIDENRLFAYSSKQILQYNLDDEMNLSKKLNKILVQNKVDYIKALIPLTDIIHDQDQSADILYTLTNSSGQKLSNYLLLFTHEGVLKFINSNNLSIAKNEINLSSLDNQNYSYSSQIRKVAAGNDGNCLLVITNHDDSSQQVFQLNIINNTLRQQSGQFKDKITKFQSINQETYITIEDYQDLSIWQSI